MQVRLAFSVVVLAVLSAVSSAAATPARAPTQMYRGQTNAGTIEPVGLRHWSVDCPNGNSGSEVFIGARRRRIYVRHWDGNLDGYADLQSSGRWTIYRASVDPGERWKPVGLALRRSATRWEILKGRRRVGHTIGPDGPEAAAAFFGAYC
jgi:hypothetical protein